jgi:glutamine phosphoribosylpyrophosphate amidotransferase
VIESTGSGRDDFCRACFDGEYPVPIPERIPEKLQFEESLARQLRD